VPLLFLSRKAQRPNRLPALPACPLPNIADVKCGLRPHTSLRSFAHRKALLAAVPRISLPGAASPKRWQLSCSSNQNWHTPCRN